MIYPDNAATTMKKPEATVQAVAGAPQSHGTKTNPLSGNDVAEDFAAGAKTIVPVERENITGGSGE